MVWQGSAGDRRPYADQVGLLPATGLCELAGRTTAELCRKHQVLIRLQGEDFDFCPQRGNARVPPKVFGARTRADCWTQSANGVYQAQNPLR